MTISSDVQSGFLQDGKDLIRIPPRSIEAQLSASAKKRTKRIRDRKTLHSSRRLVWTAEEHDRFLEALEMFPSGPWRLIAGHVGTRSTRQAMTHAQKYRQKIERRKKKQLAQQSPNAATSKTHKQPQSPLPCSPTTCDTALFTLPSPVQLDSEHAQSEANSGMSVSSDPAERALMSFLDDFQPLAMDCDDSLAILDDFADDEPFWLDVNAITASIDANATTTTAVTAAPSYDDFGAFLAL